MNNSLGMGFSGPAFVLTKNDEIISGVHWCIYYFLYIREAHITLVELKGSSFTVSRNYLTDTLFKISI